MTDHEKLMLALFAGDDLKPEGPVTVEDVVLMLYELGDRYRERVALPVAS